MRTWIFLQLAALAAVCSWCVAQQDCSRGACFPPTGELLIGREHLLTASSTCGLNEPEIFCTPFGLGRMKCCPCDSRNPAGPNAHTLQNILPGARTDRWWQSKKDVNPVTLQLDLQQLFQVDNVMLSFKGPRPDAIVIERTKDFGKTWQPALYMAADCSSSFPWVATATPYNLGNTYCHTLPPMSSNPYQDQRIYFHPLHQYSSTNYAQSSKIKEVGVFTGLRVNLTRLADVPRTSGRSGSRFYALKEIQVTGTCFCNGHANRCLTDPNSNYLPTAQVNGVCDCQHNTAGVNCERCAEFYNDLPWRPAEQDNTHTCKRCECNNHSNRCHFDSGVFSRSGGRSGGVCDDCLHNTEGQHCEHCAALYYRNPLTTKQHPDTCLPCQCDSAGSVGGGQCDRGTGQCVCKTHVEGRQCDRCKAGFYGLNAANTLGCSLCSCSATGSVHSVCDAVTGQCPCRPGFLGRTCSGCPDNTYGNPLTGCKSCECDSSGTIPGGCDRQTGVCRCKPGTVGTRCDTCARGRCASFPQCPVCPSCFFSLDTQMQNLTQFLDRLARLPYSPLDTVFPAHLADRIRSLEDKMLKIKTVLKVPLRLEPILSEYQDTLLKLGVMVDGLSSRLLTDPSSDLQGELDKLQAILANISFNFQAKQKAILSGGGNQTGALAAIKRAHNESAEAEKRAKATGKTVNESAAIRENATKHLDSVQPANTKNLQTLGKDLATRPNLTPTAAQICGSNRTTPCTPQTCEGELCPAAGASPCGQGEFCAGALPQALRAAQDTEEVKTRLQQLNNNITQAYTQIQQTQNSANGVRLATDELANQIKHTRDDLDEDLKANKDFIKRLKDFLSDNSSDPAEVQRVCEAVLGVKLPEGAESLKRKLQELQDLASTLPNSSRVLKEAEPKLQEAQRLLQDAQKTRNESLSLQEESDRLLAGLNKSKDIITNMENNLKKSMVIVNNVKDDVQKAGQALNNADRLMEDAPTSLGSMRGTLEQVKKDVRKTEEFAREAEKQAGGAYSKANQTVLGLEDLEKKLEELKRNANASSQAKETEPRLQALKQNITALVQDTKDMLQRLTDKERSLQNGAKELQNNATLLAGLEEELQKLVLDISNNATNLAMCQG